MALVDPNIAMGYRGIEVPNQLAQYGQLAQIQNAQNQNSLAQYQLGAAQRAEAKDVARTNALSKAGADDTAIANALLQSGDLKGYSDFLKTRRETQKADAELVDTKLKQSRSFLDTIDPSDPDAPNKYIAWHEANHKDPVLGPVLAARGITADQSRQRIMDAIQKGPAAFATLVNQSKLGSEKFIEMNKPQLSTKDTGGQLIDRTFEPLTGKITPLGTTAKTMTPGEIASNRIAQGNLAVSQGQLKVAQDRLAKDGAALDPSENAAIGQAIIDGRLDPNKVNGRNAKVIATTLLANPGANLLELGVSAAGAMAGERALAGMTAKMSTAANEAKEMIEIAKDFSSKVDRTQFPTINAIFNAVDKGTGGKEIVELNTAINAVVNSYARAINPTGVSTVSDKNHAREIVNSAYSNGQLDSIFNVMLKEMQVARKSADTASTELKASREVARGRSEPPAAPPAANPVKITGDADYSKLPSGAVFIGPDGKQRRKP